MFEDSSPYIGRRYELIAPIGRGGMGAVFSARDRLTGHTIALKCLELLDDLGEGELDLDTNTIDIPSQGESPVHAACLSQDKAQQLRIALSREFHTLSSLRHPNIISVIDFGFDAVKRPFFTMELLIAPRTITEAGQSLPLLGKLRLLAQLLRALIYLHRRGILHRDLKPSNILCSGEVVKVVDFGIATCTKNIKDLAGTLEYMAPEILLGQAPSTASDLYAAGVLAYELLTGRFPYSRDSVTKMLLGVLGNDSKSMISDTAMRLLRNYNFPGSAQDSTAADRVHPDIPEGLLLEGIPAALTKLVCGLLSRRLEQRYHDAALVLSELSDAIGESFPAETTATRESFLQAAELVGRDVEVERLSAALGRAFSGQGSAWLIGGESGVGKSRLLDELRTIAMVRGAHVVRGQAVNVGGVAYQVWQGVLRPLCLEAEVADIDAGILRAAVPDISSLLMRPVMDPPTLDPQNAQIRFLVTVERLLLAKNEPLVILLEDLQWADSSSLAVLSRLLRSISQHPILLIGSYRNDERPTFPAEFPSAQCLPLRRFSAEEVALLCIAMLGEAGKHPDIIALLERETEGNAYFIVEIARALAEEAGALGKIWTERRPSRVVAGGIQAIILRRLARVPEDVRPFLCAAAVLGRELDVNVLRALPKELSERMDSHLQACAAASVLEVSENRWRFSHDKLREALVSEITVEQRTRWHRQIGEAIEKAYAADLDPHAAVLAHHFDQAGEPSRALHFFTRSAQQSYERYDLQEMQRQADRGVACGAQGMELGILHALQFHAAIGIGDWPRALTLGAEALKDLVAGNLTWCRLIGFWGGVLCFTGEADLAMEVARSFVDVEPYADAKTAYLYSGMYFVILFCQGGLRAGATMVLERMEQIAATATAKDMQIKAPIQFSQATYLRSFQPNPWRQIVAAQEAATVYRQIGNFREACICENMVGEMQAESGDWDSGEALLRRGLALATRLNQPNLITAGHLHLASVLVRRKEPGALLEAGEFLKKVFAVSGLSIGFRGWGHGLQAWMLFLQQRFEEAEADARRSMELSRVAPLRRLQSIVTLVYILLKQGRNAEARALAEDGLIQADSLGGGGYNQLPLLLATAEARQASGDSQGAATAVRSGIDELKRRAVLIPDPVSRMQYLTKIAEHARITALAQEFPFSED